MKLLRVIEARSFCAIRLTGTPHHTLADNVRRIVDRYGFIRYPTRPEEFLPPDPNKGVLFQAGGRELDGRMIVIDTLQIFPSGISIATRHNTADSDLLIEDLLANARELGAEFERIRPGYAHSSQLEIRLEKSLSEMFFFLSEIGTEIVNNLDEFWQIKIPPYELTTVNLWSDQTKAPVIAPAHFMVERRALEPFEQNAYFSAAPLNTDKHIAVLKKLEDVCLRVRG